MRRFTLFAVAVAVAAAVAAAALAVTFVDVQANNPQVAGDPTSNTTARFPTNKSNEPSIAVNPLNADFLVAGANDEQRQPPCGPGLVRGSVPANDCSFFPGVGSDGFYTSSTGGTSWINRGLLPGYSEFPGEPGTLVSDGDPRIVYGPAPDATGSFADARRLHAFVNGARAYYGGLASFVANAAKGNQVPELLAVSTSDNNGATWSDPVVAANGHGFLFNDHEDVWADKNAASPFFGRVYVSYTHFRGSVFTFFAEPIRVAFSDDGGKTWSNPTQISPAHNNNTVGGRQDSTVRTGPDGTVYVAWDDGDIDGDKQVVAISHDGGVSFSKPIKVAPLTGIADPIPGANFRDGSYPSLGVDQRAGSAGRSLEHGERLRLLPGARRGAQRSRRSRLPGTEGEDGEHVRDGEREDQQLLHAVDRRTELEPIGEGHHGRVRPGGVGSEQSRKAVLGRLQHARLQQRQRVVHLHGLAQRSGLRRRR